MKSRYREKVLDLRSVFGIETRVTTPPRPPTAPTSSWTARSIREVSIEQESSVTVSTHTGCCRFPPPSVGARATD